VPVECKQWMEYRETYEWDVTIGGTGGTEKVRVKFTDCVKAKSTDASKSIQADPLTTNLPTNIVIKSLLLLDLLLEKLPIFNYLLNL